MKWLPPFILKLILGIKLAFASGLFIIKNYYSQHREKLETIIRIDILRNTTSFHNNIQKESLNHAGAVYLVPVNGTGEKV